MLSGWLKMEEDQRPIMLKTTAHHSMVHGERVFGYTTMVVKEGQYMSEIFQELDL